MTESSGCKPEIHYPCQWQFRLIGEHRAAMIEAIRSFVTTESYQTSDGNISSGGRYLSLVLDLTVQSDEERLRLYQNLSSHPAIKVVI